MTRLQLDLLLHREQVVEPDRARRVVVRRVIRLLDHRVVVHLEVRVVEVEVVVVVGVHLRREEAAAQERHEPANDLAPRDEEVVEHRGEDDEDGRGLERALGRRLEVRGLRQEVEHHHTLPHRLLAASTGQARWTGTRRRASNMMPNVQTRIAANWSVDSTTL